MKLLRRNLVPVYYCLYSENVPLVDDEGYETGETGIGYEALVCMRFSVSPAMGYTQTEMFGNIDSYDKVLITDDVKCPIDENTVLFIDKEPQFKDGNPLYDYKVKRVAKSLNFISYAVSKVRVS